MRAVSVAVLAVCGAAALGAGWYFGSATTPAQQTTEQGEKLMYPGLAAKLADVAKLEITHQNSKLVIEKRPDGAWGVASLHGYPIQDSKLRGLLTGLTELRLIEPRTKDPAEYKRIGVEDPNDEGASSNWLRVMNRGGQDLVSLVVGHKRVRSQGSLGEEVYVRRAGDFQSWLAQGTLQADADPALWLNRDVINMPHDRIASVDVGDGALVFGTVDGKFALKAPAEHPKLEEYKLEDVSRALELLTFQSVKPDGDLTATEVGHAVFTTNDGLAVTVRVLHADKDVWVRLTAHGPAAVKQEADRLNLKLAGWSYQVGAWKEKSLVPKLDDLKAADQAPAPAAAVAPSAAPAPAPVPAPSADAQPEPLPSPWSAPVSATK